MTSKHSTLIHRKSPRGKSKQNTSVIGHLSAVLFQAAALFQGLAAVLLLVSAAASLHAQDRTPYAESENDFLFIRLSTLSWDSAALNNSFQMDSPRRFSDLLAGKDTVRLGTQPEGLTGSEIALGYRWDEFPGYFVHTLFISRFDASTSKTEFANTADTALDSNSLVTTTNTVSRTDAISSSGVERTAMRYHGDYLIVKHIEALREMAGPAAPFLEQLGIRLGADIVYETITHRGVRIEPITFSTTSTAPITMPTSTTDAQLLTHTFKENKWNVMLGLSYRYTILDRFTVDVAASRIWGVGSGSSSFKLQGQYSVSSVNGLNVLPFFDLNYGQTFDVETRGDIKEAGLTIHLYGPVSFRVGYEAQSITYALTAFGTPTGTAFPRMAFVSTTSLFLTGGGASGESPESQDISKRLTFELQYRLR